MKRRLLKNQKGTEVVEFAIVSVLLFLVLFGIIDFGLLLFDKQVITNASREGARRGIVQNTQRIQLAEIQTVVTNYCQSYLVNFSNTPLTITADNLTGGGTNCRTGATGFGDNLRVTVTYPYTFLAIPYVVSAAGGSLGNITLEAHTTMKCE